MLCACKWSKLCHGPVVSLSYATKLYHVNRPLVATILQKEFAKSWLLKTLSLEHCVQNTIINIERDNNIDSKAM